MQAGGFVLDTNGYFQQEIAMTNPVFARFAFVAGSE